MLFRSNMKELEIYSPNGVAPMFDGLGALGKAPDVTVDVTTETQNTLKAQIKNVAATAMFGMSPIILAEIEK